LSSSVSPAKGCGSSADTVHRNAGAADRSVGMRSDGDVLIRRLAPHTSNLQASRSKEEAVESSTISADQEQARMTKFVLATIVVMALLIGGLIGLLRGRRAPMAPPEVLDRVKQRNRELEAQERREGED
jgi:hypothetical protein